MATAKRNTRKAPRFHGAQHGVIPARAGTYSVPVAYLDACPAQAWDPARATAIQAAHDAGLAAHLPAITVTFFEDGSLRLTDGNHRLAVARERGEGRVLVRYQRGGKRPAGEQFAIPAQPGGQARPATWEQMAA